MSPLAQTACVTGPLKILVQNPECQILILPQCQNIIPKPESRGQYFQSCTLINNGSGLIHYESGKKFFLNLYFQFTAVNFDGPRSTRWSVKIDPLSRKSCLLVIGDAMSYLILNEFEPFDQTLANWGPYSRFVLEVFIKALISKSS